MTYRDTMRELARRTEPDPDAVHRVHARLGKALTPTTALLDALPDVSPHAATRVRARLAEGRRRRRMPVAAWAAGLSLAAAAVAAALWLPAAPPEAVTLELAASGTTDVGSHVALDWAGSGHADGTAHDLTVAWREGRLGAVVTPDAGVTMQVETREATVAVVGTAFDVHRDARGTRVTVDEGVVSVTCHRAAAGAIATDALTPGDEVECLPISAAGMLGRAQALRDDDAGADVVLSAVDDGLALVDDADHAVHVELLVERMGVLLATGRSGEALEAAEGALALRAGARSEELHRVVARLHLRDGDCEAALPHLRAIAAPTDDERAHLERCAAR